MSGLALFVGGWAGVQLLSGGNRSSSEVVQTPLLLEATKRLGQLRTARHEFSRILEVESHREPQDWARYVPGAASLVTASTRNTGLIRTQGYVEAGVDLSKAKITREAHAYVVQIPSSQIMGVEAKAWVVHRKPGMFWNDDNLSARGVEQARREYRAASEQKGILKQADEEAKARLQALLGEIADQPVQIEFLPNL